MTLQEKLELAARVMPGVGKVHNANTGEEFMAILDSNPHHHCINGEGRWHPNTDDGDSRRLEIALRKHCFVDHPRPFEAWPEHIQILWEQYGSAADSGDAEQYRAAVLDLAAAIGEVINAA